MDCVICGLKVEGEYGHNPAPLPVPEGRACDWCNTNVIVPVRLRRHMYLNARQD